MMCPSCGEEDVELQDVVANSPDLDEFTLLYKCSRCGKVFSQKLTVLLTPTVVAGWAG